MFGGERLAPIILIVILWRVPFGFRDSDFGLRPSPHTACYRQIPLNTAIEIFPRWAVRSKEVCPICPQSRSIKPNQAWSNHRTPDLRLAPLALHASTLHGRLQQKYDEL